MSGKESEAFVDEILQQMRTRDMMEAIFRLLSPKSSMAEKDPLYNHRQNLHLRKLSEAYKA